MADSFTLRSVCKGMVGLIATFCALDATAGDLMPFSFELLLCKLRYKGPFVAKGAAASVLVTSFNVTEFADNGFDTAPIVAGFSDSSRSWAALRANTCVKKAPEFDRLRAD